MNSQCNSILFNSSQCSTDQLEFQNKHVFTIDDGKNNRQSLEIQEACKTLVLGRTNDCDIFITENLVSRKHAEIVIDGSQCYINDLGSTNGTYLNNFAIEQASFLKNGDEISFHNSCNQLEGKFVIKYDGFFCCENVTNENKHIQNVDIITIGRSPENDIVIDHPTVSRHHAVVVKTIHGCAIEDKSTNGTFLNGIKVSKLTELTLTDHIVIANATLAFNGAGIDYFINEGGLSVDAVNLIKRVKNKKDGYKVLIDHVSLSINPGEFVTIVGGSGAGKSTLMDCLNGFRPATSGNVIINGEDFYENYNAYKNIIGYVPQKDIVYDNLTVRQMLRYSARLRMSRDSSNWEVEKRVSEVIYDVKLIGKEDLLIKRLSGGQKKRVSIAVELLADPKLLFLDEPTSGLDPGLDKSLMELLRILSHKGKTIILITHATSNIYLCDKVVFLGSGGRLCYFGKPEGMVEFFETSDISDIYKKLSITENISANDEVSPEQKLEDTSEYFSQKLTISPHYSKTIDLLMVERHNIITKDKFSKPVGCISQFFVLIERYLKLIFSDLISMCIMFGQAPLMVLILKGVAASDTFGYYDASKQLLFVISSMATIMGLLNSFLEVCKEREIFKRERAASVGLLPYILSKVAVLGLFCFMQSVVLVGGTYAIITPPNRGITGNTMFEFWFTIFLTLLSSTSVGLLISCLSPNTERATLIMPLAVIPQIVFSGILFKLEGIKMIISYGIITRWSTSSLASTFDINSLKKLSYLKNLPQFSNIPIQTQKIFEHTKNLLFSNWGIMIVITVACLVFCTVLLSRTNDK